MYKKFLKTTIICLVIFQSFDPTAASDIGATVTSHVAITDSTVALRIARQEYLRWEQHNPTGLFTGAPVSGDLHGKELDETYLTHQMMTSSGHWDRTLYIGRYLPGRRPEPSDEFIDPRSSYWSKVRREYLNGLRLLDLMAIAHIPEEWDGATAIELACPTNRAALVSFIEGGADHAFFFFLNITKKCSFLSDPQNDPIVSYVSTSTTFIGVDALRDFLGRGYPVMLNRIVRSTLPPS